ncbi:MAG: alkaline phosphatase D family protein [Polyangiales bacterium]
MHLIIGHTTHNSAWIWVRGDRRNRNLRVEIKTADCSACGETTSIAERSVEVGKKRDYTEVVRFDELRPCTRYKVTLRSATSFQKVEGHLRTFPESNDTNPFHFLHGSCHVSTARLTALGNMAAGLLGGAATSKALERPFEEWDMDRLTGWKRVLGFLGIRSIVRWAAKYADKAVGWYTFLTRWEQPRPLLPSPFEPLLAAANSREDASNPDKFGGAGRTDPIGQDEETAQSAEDERGRRPAFMIHCGDQIYYDLDIPPPEGTTRDETKDYRRNYRQAWFDDESAACLLRSFPQYMMLDDHEIIDGFGTEPTPSGDEDRLRAPALRAYDEYVSCRQPRCDPDDGFYYTFEHGNTGFFVLDTRTERSAEHKQMVSEKQLVELEKWLLSPSLGLKFVVSSVPFVAELRPPGLDRNGERRGDERADKWCGDAWRLQRERIISAIYENDVERVVFLVGDMHCTYHARMLIGDVRRRVTVHELAGGPLNQLQFAKRTDFYARYAGTFPKPFEKSEGDGSNEDALPEAAPEVLPWTSTIESFHGASPSVLKISVTPQSDSTPLEVRWTALRTHPTPVEPEPRHNLAKPLVPHDLCGRIRFHRSPAEVM